MVSFHSGIKASSRGSQGPRTHQSRGAAGPIVAVELLSLDHAILGFLNYQPFSGYDLKKIFDATVQHFWPAEQSQIYRTLTRLTEQGCVEMEKVDQSDRPDRKVYHITKAGRQELTRWLMAPPPMTVARRAALVQVFFLGQLTDKEALDKFESFAVMMRGILKVYDQSPEKIDMCATQIGTPREMYFWLSTLDPGKRTMRANLEWAESVISQIKDGKIPRKRAARAKEPRIRPARSTIRRG
jgi:PadR family transcriptional regulator, regulatory protein AphA